MEYRVDLTIEGYIEVKAESEGEARKIAEDGYPLGSVKVESDEINEITELPRDSHLKIASDKE